MKIFLLFFQIFKDVDKGFLTFGTRDLGYICGVITCLQLFAKWRRSAHLKLSQLIFQQQNVFNKQTR